MANNAASALVEEAGIENEAVTGAIGEATGQIVEESLSQSKPGASSEVVVNRTDSDMTGHQDDAAQMAAGLSAGMADMSMSA